MLANDVFEKVNTVLQKKLGKLHPELSFTNSVVNEEEPSLPCLLIRHLNPKSINGTLLHNAQVGVLSTVRIESYSNDSYEEAEQIIHDAGDILIEMGYDQNNENEISTNVWRFVATYSRPVMNGDSFNL